MSSPFNFMAMTWKHRLSNIDMETKTATCAACGQVKLKISIRHGQREGELSIKCKKAWSQRQARTPSARRHSANRRPYRKYVGTTCELCGFVPIHLAQLDCHHKDGNHANNEQANLITLCANCHRLQHVRGPKC